MSSTTVRIDEKTRDALRDIAESTGEPMQTVLAKAVEAYRRRRILDEANAAFAALRADPVAWQEELDERREWAATPVDGLEKE